MYKLSVRDRLTKLFQWELKRYIPTAFDNTHSLEQKVNILVKGYDELVNMVNAYERDNKKLLEKGFEIIDKNTETQLKLFADELKEEKEKYENIREELYGNLLPDSVKENLELWFAEGRFHDLITDEIFTDMESRIESLENKIEDVNISVKDFGALGDGTDQTAEIQEAINYVGNKGGGILRVPAGKYTVSETFEVMSNTTIVGEGNSTEFIRNTDGNAHILFRSTGSRTCEMPITQNATRGDKELYLNVSKGENDCGSIQDLKMNDYIMIQGQRDVMHKDAGDWQLGRATSESHRLYQGEIKKISEVLSDRIRFESGLIFPDYNTHDRDETSEKARKNTTVMKVDYNHNISIGGFKLKGRWLHVVQFENVRHSVIHDVEYYDISIGALTTLVECYQCEVRDCIAIFDTRFIGSVDYYQRNPFKTNSSFMCGFVNCKAENGSQTVDITYRTNKLSIPDMYSYIKDCVFYGSTSAGITTHPGTYSPTITGNQLIDCYNHGIYSRSRHSLISSNKCTSTIRHDHSHFGIGLTNGSAQDSLITGNVVTGFPQGVRISDGAWNGYRRIGAVITGNHFSDTIYGIHFTRVYNNPGEEADISADVIISDNMFTNFDETGDSVGNTYGVYISRHYKGIFIKDNVFKCNGNSTKAIRGAGNVWGIHIEGNKFINNGGDVIYLYPVTDTTTYPYSTHPNFLDSTNYFDVPVREYRLNQVDWMNHRFSQNIVPSRDNVYLGVSASRFYALYLQNEPFVSSDERLKSNIKELDVGLDLIDILNPISFTKDNAVEKDKNKIAFGLSAQEFEKAVEQLNIDSDTLNMIDKDGEYYALRYSELIPVIIKAIQDLRKQ